MSPMLAVLDELRKSRSIAMYVGRISLSKLADFLRGYEHAITKLGHGEDRFLADFHDWLFERFSTRENRSWEGLILDRSKDELEAVQRFWELLDEFLARLKGEHAQMKAPANIDQAMPEISPAANQPHSS